MRKILVLLIIFFGCSFYHPFYLSVTDLKYNAKEKALQGSVKMFVNDLEAALKKLNNKNTDLINVKDTVEVVSRLNAYLQAHLQLKLNGKGRSFKTLGFEREEEALWVFIEYKGCELPKTLEVDNSILYDFIDEQTNIVHVEVGDQKKSWKVSKPDKHLLFSF